MCKLNISIKDKFSPEIKFNLLDEKKMKANLNESSRFQLNRTEKTTEKRLLNSSNRATIVCTYEEQLAAQKTFFPNLASKQMKKSSTFLLRLGSTIYS